MRQFVSPLKIALLSSSKTGCLLRITYLKTESPHLVGRATPDAAGKARPTVNHLTVMNYVKLNSAHQIASEKFETDRSLKGGAMMFNNSGIGTRMGIAVIAVCSLVFAM